MLLPQSSAFAALKNRLNSVSAIGYLHIAPRPYVTPISLSRNNSVVEAVSNLNLHSRQKSNASETHGLSSSSAPTPAGTSNYDRPNRLKGRDAEGIKWTELLEKFKAVQERARRAQRPGGEQEDVGLGETKSTELDAKALKDLSRLHTSTPSAKESGPPTPGSTAPGHKPKNSLGRLGRLGGGMTGGRPKR